MDTHAAGPWYDALARREERRAARLDAGRAEAVELDVHHLYYMLLRWEGLGYPVGPMDVPVPERRAVVSRMIPAAPAQDTWSASDDVRSLLSFSGTVQTVAALWNTQPTAAAPGGPDRVFRVLYTLLSRTRAVRLVPAPPERLAEFTDLPGTFSVPMHAFKGLLSLQLRGVEPDSLLGWNRLCVQLEKLACSYMSMADVTDLFVGLVLRDAAAERGRGNELTFLPASALTALTSVVHLDLSSNLLNAVPPALSMLPQLRLLNLADNLVDSVLGIYRALPSIRVLNLRANRLENVCGVERLQTLEQIDLRGNELADAGEIGRLAALPHISHVWIADNPVAQLVPDCRVVCFAKFALEGADGVYLDDARPSFWERRRIAERLSHRVSARGAASASIEARLSSRVRRVTLLPQDDARADGDECAPPAAAAATSPSKARRARRSTAHLGTAASAHFGTAASTPSAPSARTARASLGAAGAAGAPSPSRATRAQRRSDAAQPMASRPLKEHIERLRGDAGDDWLRLFARGEFGAGARSPAAAPSSGGGASRGGAAPSAGDAAARRAESAPGAPASPARSPPQASPYPVKSIAEPAPVDLYAWPTRIAVQTLSSPWGSAAVSATALVAGTYIWRRYLRRIPTAAYLTPAVMRTRRVIVGRVTSVGDADGFRVFHTPGLPFVRSLMYRAPTKAADLRDQTISVRLAGVDAPEAPHFGRAGQPFAKEARAYLTHLVDGRTVWLDVAHVDQYQRLVATPYVFMPPYVFGRTNVSLALARNGLATVYRNAGATYGTAPWWQRFFFGAETGKRQLEFAEDYAKVMRLGMWSRGLRVETPGEYKRRNGNS
ncbi:micrococcal nuclease [Malassezia sp. CBS 17886]|nr:micrococcal nuclease [Malassezia sp. CBS 17886]